MIPRPVRRRQVEVLHWLRRAPRAPETPAVDRQERASARPKIGLALGGGAARGWAHIGVLRALKSAGIEPDVIAGTSMGAVVGGAYAAGRLDELEDWARSVTRRRMLGFLDIKFWSTGLIGGGRLAGQLKETFGDVAIDELPLRYAAIATEIGTGHEIWLTQGSLVEAMRASYALPGIFPPVKVAGRWLMDGALINPIPVSAARALGARVVIAVNPNADMFGRGTVIQEHGLEPAIEAAAVYEPRGVSAVMVEAFNITQDRIARSRLAGDPPDLMIAPKLGHMGMFEFARADEAIRLGAEAIERALPELTETIAALG
jgi:NTE family protein